VVLPIALLPNTAPLEELELLELDELELLELDLPELDELELLEDELEDELLVSPPPQAISTDDMSNNVKGLSIALLRTLIYDLGTCLRCNVSVYCSGVKFLVDIVNLTNDLRNAVIANDFFKPAHLQKRQYLLSLHNQNPAYLSQFKPELSAEFVNGFTLFCMRRISP
jgi:hypothetical protein